MKKYICYLIIISILFPHRAIYAMKKNEEEITDLNVSLSIKRENIELPIMESNSLKSLEDLNCSLLPQEEPFLTSFSSSNNDPKEIEMMDLSIVGSLEENQESLKSYIYKYFINQEEITELYLKKLLRKSSPFVSLILGGITSVSYYSLGYRAGQGHDILGVFIGLSYALTIASTASWAYFNVIKDFLKPESYEEKIILEKNKSSVGIFIIAHTLSLFTPTPSTYAIYKYNKHKWFALTTYPYAYCFDTLGLKTFFEEIISKYKKSKDLVEKNSIEKFRKNIVNHLQNQTIPVLLKMPQEEKDKLIDSLKKTTLSPEEYINLILGVSYEENPIQKNPDTWKKGWPRSIMTTAFSMGAVMNMMANSYFAYKGWSLFFESNYARIPLSLLSVVPAFSLELKSIYSTSISVYNAAFYKFFGGAIPSLGETLYPKILNTLPFLSFFLGSMVAYVCQFVDYDSLEEILPKELAFTISIGASASCFFFGAYATHSLIKDMIYIYAQSFAPISTRKLANIIKDVENLAQTFQKTKPEKLNEFMNETTISGILPSSEPSTEILSYQDDDISNIGLDIIHPSDFSEPAQEMIADHNSQNSSQNSWKDNLIVRFLKRLFSFMILLKILT